ncbi:bifunctional folylpolyglutamate synthase/dihydrofolate synthase [Segniliparus rugosus]|uniref:Dihydrofolate synthase/folylpolyglutamate synthase n=1 Tax=Segniliparus rugosus (strain ATCC BAA-974 / DSM 45345 / CCUG 50838 / CIP 108380 / JCM 13579 / CDC 945) TaxID=679197 RepID=E5XNY3_SEGRC|nr:folylpolyglutamate synthase/dihydrofolate synthase family protein [Segniliparus rugosus]EFV13952.1 FolC protein [Segniliparus rugosus ATCC BAA-974]
MSEFDPAEFQAVEAELDARWPETKIEPSLTRIAALMDLLGSPQRAYPSIHIAGTNGKTSTTRMVDALLTATGLRTGRILSPHLQSPTERISLGDQPITEEQYVSAWREIEPLVHRVDASSRAQGGPAMSKFEVLVAMAYTLFAEAPVDVAVVEVGMGGRWDATNVIDGHVAVLAPISLDHVEYLGSDLSVIAGEKAGIVKRLPKSEGGWEEKDQVVVTAEQNPAALRAILAQVEKAGAVLARSGQEFAVTGRSLAVGGQQIGLRGLGAVYPEVFLPLYGPHQAANASLALAAVEAFFGAGPERSLAEAVVLDGFANARSPGRLERMPSGPGEPLVLADAAHNPHGATALASALAEDFPNTPFHGVLSVMGDKDVRGVLEALKPALASVVVTDNGSPRALPAAELAELARTVFEPKRVVVQPDFAEAVGTAKELAAPKGEGVLITGSVVTAGAARDLYGLAPS